MLKSKEELIYDISIVIPTWNNYKLLNKLIASINIINKKDISVELIVIDDTPADKRVPIDILALTKFQNCELIINKQNIGFTKSLNIGLSMVKGRTIIILNDDIECLEDTFENLANLLITKANFRIIAPMLIFKDGIVQKSIRRFPRLKYFFLKKFQDYYFCKDINYYQLQEVEQPMFAAIIINKTVFDKVGYLDESEDYRMYFSDVDWCKRAYDQNIKILYTPDIKFIHHHGTSGNKLGLKKQLLWIYGLRRYIIKYGSSIEKIIMRYFWIVLLIGKTLHAKIKCK